MRRLYRLAVALLLIPSTGQASSFLCKISEVKSISDTGDFEPHALERTYMDYDILIDRDTGLAFHPGFGNEYFNSRSIIDPGSGLSSFKVIATTKSTEQTGADKVPFTNMSFIQIQTHVGGAKKPFFALSGSAMASGLCE